MCGRFSLASEPSALFEEFGLYPPAAWEPRYNIAPTQDVLVLAAGRSGARMGMVRWGLVPPGAPDARGGARLINARGETLERRPAFRDAYRRRRCLVLADGFYEWRVQGGGKQPVRIRLADGAPFALGGLWERWRGPGGETLGTCTIVTTPPSEAVATLHDRMPLLLGRAERARWLDPGAGAAELRALVRPYPGGDLIWHPV
ncbi:MAG TPA: SOS response-associated peptidase, partial [Longimicrobiales bacterium]|nr:SOS response-associated peptidase [Longimicrobiales bacterium]